MREAGLQLGESRNDEIACARSLIIEQLYAMKKMSLLVHTARLKAKNCLPESRESLLRAGSVR